MKRVALSVAVLSVLSAIPAFAKFGQTLLHCTTTDNQSLLVKNSQGQIHTHLHNSSDGAIILTVSEPHTDARHFFYKNTAHASHQLHIPKNHTHLYQVSSHKDKHTQNAKVGIYKNNHLSQTITCHPDKITLSDLDALINTNTISSKRWTLKPCDDLIF